jgi:hypothetical protein
VRAESGDWKPERDDSPRRDFRERTFQFGIRCVRLVESLPKTLVAQPLQAEAKEIIAIMVSSIKTARKGARK